MKLSNKFVKKDFISRNFSAFSKEDIEKPLKTGFIADNKQVYGVLKMLQQLQGQNIAMLADLYIHVNNNAVKLQPEMIKPLTEMGLMKNGDVTPLVDNVLRSLPYQFLIDGVNKYSPYATQGSQVKIVNLDEKQNKPSNTVNTNTIQTQGKVVETTEQEKGR